MKKVEPPIPQERAATVRAQLIEELGRGPASARELARRLGLREKEIADHLEHVARTLEAQGLRLEVEPAQCRSCGFAFKHRARLTRPSRCPQCRSEQIEPPLFSAR